MPQVPLEQAKHTSISTELKPLAAYDEPGGRRELDNLAAHGNCPSFGQLGSDILPMVKSCGGGLPEHRGTQGEFNNILLDALNVENTTSFSTSEWRSDNFGSLKASIYAQIQAKFMSNLRNIRRLSWSSMPLSA